MQEETADPRRENSVSFGSFVSMQAARLNGLTYSKLIAGLTKAGIEVNRKMLSELAINDPAGFAKICDAAKNA